MNPAIAWERTIRTGHPASDEQEAANCRAHAAAQGLLFEQFSVPQGGVHVRAGFPPQPGFSAQPMQPARAMQPSQPMQSAPAMHPAAGGAVLATSRCQGCGVHAETKSVVLVQNIGVVVLRFQKVLRGHFCKRCIRSAFWRMTTIMFFFGWWGVISFVFTVIGIPTNCVQYLRTLSMKDAPAR